jgi:hypothetical protein
MRPNYKPTYEGELTEVIVVLTRNMAHKTETNEITHFKFKEYYQARLHSSGERLDWYHIDARMHDE